MFILAVSLPQYSGRDLIYSSFQAVAKIAALPAMPSDNCSYRPLAGYATRTGCMPVKIVVVEGDRFKEEGALGNKWISDEVFLSFSHLVYACLT